MSDALDIRSGGAVAVDTTTLRRAADDIRQLADGCDEVRRLVSRAEDAARERRLPVPFPLIPVHDAESRALALADALRHRADVYEALERAVAARMAGTGPVARGTGAEGAVAGGAEFEAERLLAAWRASRHGAVEQQLRGALGPFWDVAQLVSSLLAAVRAAGLGAVPGGAAPLRGDSGPVAVRELSRAPTRAPASIEELIARTPGDGDARVRVEVYGDDTAGRQYVVYIAGTQTFTHGGDDAWDMQSNIELYTRQRSASYAAVEQAVHLAGARRGDPVHIVGHSQGAMLATHLARDGGFDVRSLVAVASPVQAALPGDALQVTLRHLDDPVAALAAGGIPTAAGSRDSLVVERVFDPQVRPDDLTLSSHHLAAYLETAALLDRSDDPRVDTVRARLESLSAAGAATAIMYGAHRERTPAPTASARGGRAALSGPA